jgi:hypothetical protein
MPDPFFEPYHTSFAFLQDVKWYRQGLQSTFPSWQCQIPCRYRRPLTPWETFFRNVLLLNLCSISVPLRFYLCCIFDCISLSLLTTVKLNKHSTPKKKFLYSLTARTLAKISFFFFTAKYVKYSLFILSVSYLSSLYFHV